MPTSRYEPGVAALDNKMYVTGGRDGHLIMPSVDCYDPDTNTWSQVANMNIAREGHSMVSLHGRLYAIGGWGVDSVEVYDPDNNTWTLLQQKLDGKVFGNGDLSYQEILSAICIVVPTDDSLSTMKLCK